MHPISTLRVISALATVMGMQFIRKHIKSDENTLDILWPDLIGKVFHVTRQSHWQQIESRGKISPSPSTPYGSTFATKSYFGEKGCVGLFDYRSYNTKEFKNNYLKCLPTLPLNEDCGICICFPNSKIIKKLISWKEWKKDGAGKNIVPYVEVGYKGDIYLDELDVVIVVTMTENKDSLAYILKQAAKKNITNG